MKRIYLVLLLLTACLTAQTMYADETKDYKKEVAANKKAATKMAKKMAKELKKQKWEYAGATPLENILEKYYLQTLEEWGGTKKGQEHEISDATSLSMAEKRLLLLAQSTYAQEVETMLAAEIATNDHSEGGFDQEAYIAQVAAKSKHEFNGDVKRAFIIKKKNPNGKTWTVRGYYIIDENAGRLRSRQLAKDIEDNGKMIDQIHDRVIGE